MPSEGAEPPVDTIVVGGGIAGLVAAIELHRAGRRVVVYEAAPEVGGRVRSRVIDGCVIDHGFQVLFTAYPTLNRYLDHGALSLRRFLPAARIVRTPHRSALVGDAMRDLSLLWPSLTGGALGWRDLLRMRALRTRAMRTTIDACIDDPTLRGMTTRAYLEQFGFSRAAIDGFFAPFYGGILLDRSLTTRASVLLFTFKMLAEGDTAVPAVGMGAIPRQMAAQLPAGSVHTGVRVRALHVEGGAACGVVLDDGSVVRASQVVLATDVVQAQQLAQSVRLTLHEPQQVLGCTTVYYRSAQPVLPGRALWLNAIRSTRTTHDSTGTASTAAATDDAPVVSHAVTLTDVAPSYAPPGTHLIAATVLGADAMRADDDVDAAVRRDLERMSPLTTPFGATLERVSVQRIPLAQFAQPVEAVAAGQLGLGGSHSSTGATAASTSLPGLFRASEVLHSSSLEGAARGGQMAARACVS